MKYSVELNGIGQIVTIYDNWIGRYVAPAAFEIKENGLFLNGERQEANFVNWEIVRMGHSATFGTSGTFSPTTDENAPKPIGKISGSWLVSDGVVIGSSDIAAAQMLVETFTAALRTLKATPMGREVVEAMKKALEEA